MAKDTKFISFGNQKGGVGKSTLTSMMANYIHNSTKLSVAVIDADDLQSTLMKFREHDQNKPTFDANQAYDMQSISSADFPALSENLLGEYDFVFVDLPGNLKQEGVMNCYLLFDYVFIPSCLSSADLESTFQFMNVYFQLVKPERDKVGLDSEVYIALNRVDPKTKEFKEFMAGKDELPVKVLNSYITNSISYQRESSTYDNYSRKGNSEVKNFCEEILSIIGTKVNANS